ncbi:MAG: hypothetical protein LBI54_05510 [Lachnospiraceae bacterium]|jgi:hypothetical protein|nr:hypothetical protein [Lachnospiraceae bacterium]
MKSLILRCYSYGQKHSYRLLAAAYVLVIAGAGLWSLGRQGRLEIVDDGFSYWGIAASWAGYDWSDLLGVTGYFSYGYSIVLFPLWLLARLGVGMATLYRLALAINTVFLVLCFFLARHVGRRLCPEANKYFLLTVSFAVTLSISNVWNAGRTWTENYLYLMFWCLAACMLRVLDEFKVCNIVLLLLVCFNLFIIHMRALGVVIAVVLTLLLYFVPRRKEIPWKRVAFLLLGVLVLALAALLVKKLNTQYIFQNSVTSRQINNFDNMAEKAKAILTPVGLVDFAISYMGKLFYLGVSTFLLAFLGFSQMAGQFLAATWQMIRDKNARFSQENLFQLFLALSFLGAVGVATLFMPFLYYSHGTTLNTVDMVVVGRYTEYMVGPFVLLGLLALTDLKKHLHEIMFGIIVLFASAVCVQNMLNIKLFSNEAMVLRGTMAMGLTWLDRNGWQNFAYHAVFVVMFVFVSAALLLSFCQKERAALLLSSIIALSLAVFGVFYGGAGLQDMIEGKSSKDRSVGTVAEFVAANYAQGEIYYITTQRAAASSPDVKILQWTVPNNKINLIAPTELANLTKEGRLFITAADDYPLSGQLFGEMNYLYNSGSMNLFAVDAPEVEPNIRATPYPAWHNLKLAHMLTEDSFQKANGNLYWHYRKTEGYMTWPTGLTLDDGVYEFVVDLEISGYQGGEIGYIASGNAGMNVFATRPLAAADFGWDGKGSVSVTVEVMDYLEPIVGVYYYSNNSAMKVTGARYRQVRGNALAGCFAGRNDSADLAELGAIYGESASAGKALVYVDSDGSGAVGFPDLSFVAGYFGNVEPAYISGNILPYASKLPGSHLLVEKTGDGALLTGLVNEYELVGESEYYYLLYLQ